MIRKLINFKSKISYALLLSIVQLCLTSRSFAAGAITPENAVPTKCQALPDAFAWLSPISDVASDGTRLFQWLTGIFFVFSLGTGIQKYRSSKGNPDKIENANRWLFWFTGSSIAIFGVASLGNYFLNKFC